jgi:hypothetical protein
MHDSAWADLLADELVRICGWGPNPDRLVRTVVLSKMVELKPGQSPTLAGCIIKRYLRDSIVEFQEDKEFLGRMYDSQTLRRAFLVELRFEHGQENGPIRQYRVAKILGVPYSYDAWRRHPALRRGLLTLLAESMTNRQD